MNNQKDIFDRLSSDNDFEAFEGIYSSGNKTDRSSGEDIFASLAEKNKDADEESFSFVYGEEDLKVPTFGEITQNLSAGTKGIGNALLSGGIKGAVKFGESVSKAGEETGAERENLIEEKLPYEKNLINRAAASTAEELPTLISFPGSIANVVPKTIASKFVGESAKDLGAPEWAQSALEVTTFAGPDLTKKILSQGKNKEIIDFMKQHGMTDEQIAPLITSDFKKKWLSRLTPKNESTKNILTKTKEGLGNIYESIKGSSKAGKEISEAQNGKLINSLQASLSEMPRETQAKIQADLSDLLNNKITPKSLMNFFQDINKKYSLSKKELGQLKGPIKSAINSISPEIAKDFEVINSLYSKYSGIAKTLKPSIASDLVKAAETLGIAGGAARALLFGDPSYLTVFATEQGMRHMAKQFLLNPKYQQLSRKLVKAMNENKPAVAQAIMKEFNEMTKEEKKYVTQEK